MKVLVADKGKRVEPNNPNEVYVGVIGNLWKPNEERGLYKSIDGGKSWKKILYVSDKAGVGDIIFISKLIISYKFAVK